MNDIISKSDSFFVTGHNGMVGQAIIKSLKNNGYCNKKNGGILYTQTRDELDLISCEKVSFWFKKYKPKVVIIAAAKVGGILANYKYPFDFISENLRIQQNLIESAWTNGTKRLLFLGSSCIYPKSSKIPIKEEELLKSELEKTNEAYAVAKIAGIKLCEFIRKQYKFDAISLMPTNLYGPGDNYHTDNSHVLAALIKKFIVAKKNKFKTVSCWGTGKPMREFLHVNDFADACVHVLKQWDPDKINSPKKDNGEKLFYLNVGSGEELSIKELAYIIAEETKFDGKIIWDKSMPDGTFRKKLDNRRIESLGWHPQIKLRDGIKQVIIDLESKLNKEKYSSKLPKHFFN